MCAKCTQVFMVATDPFVTGPRLRHSTNAAMKAWAAEHGITASQLVHDAIHLYLKTEGGQRVPELPGFERDVLRVLRNALDGLDLAGTGINPAQRERISTQLAALAELAHNQD